MNALQAARRDPGSAGAPLLTAQAPADGTDPIAVLASAFAGTRLALVLIFASPGADFPALMAAARDRFGGAAIAGCTTAGEIGAQGYTEGEIVAVGFPAAYHEAALVGVPSLARLDGDAVSRDVARAKGSLAVRAPHFVHDFAILLADGLSLKEDELAPAISQGLGTTPLFGGSAGDGTRFRRTLVGHSGAAASDAAVLAIVRSACPVRVFSLDHLHPTAIRMVVTEADPASRTVRRINAEPAAREYARLLGKNPDDLDPFVFAARPVVVRFGGVHHVRSIQRVLPNGDLVFFSAIDEGLVLTLADPEPMAPHLSRTLQRLCEPGAPVAILACDCSLRRIEARDTQQIGSLSEVLRRFGVTGFSTYGEQMGGVHVNQTMTGVAIYPPGALP